MFKSIQTALFAAFVGVLVIGFLILFLLAAPRIKTNAVNRIADELFKQVSLTQQEYASLLTQKAGNKFLQARANKAAELSGSRVTIIAENGIVLADSGTPDQQVKDLENHGARPEVLAAKTKSRGMSSRFSTTLGKDLIYVAVPLKDSGGNITGYLRFSVPETYATQIVWKVQQAAALALIVAVLISLFLSVAFARWFSRPVIRLSQATKMIAQGKFPLTIMRRSPFEVGELEASVEEMSRRLAESFKKLSNERTQVAAIISLTVASFSFV